MNKIIASCTIIILVAATNAFALPVIDADSGLDAGIVSENLFVASALVDFDARNIDLSAIIKDIEDFSDVAIWYLAARDIPTTPGLGPPLIPGIPLGPPTDRPGVGNDTPSPVPEPATMLLFGIGLIGLAGLSRRAIR